MDRGGRRARNRNRRRGRGPSRAVRPSPDQALREVAEAGFAEPPTDGDPPGIPGQEGTLLCWLLPGREPLRVPATLISRTPDDRGAVVRVRASLSTEAEVSAWQKIVGAALGPTVRTVRGRDGRIASAVRLAWRPTGSPLLSRGIALPDPPPEGRVLLIDHPTREDTGDPLSAVLEWWQPRGNVSR